MSKMLMIMLAGGFISFGIISLSQNEYISESTTKSAKTFSSEQARSISESMSQMILTKLADNPDWREPNPVSQDFFNGSASYTVVDSMINTDSVVKINVTSEYFNYHNSIELCAKFNNLYTLPLGLVGGTLLEMHNQNNISYYNNPGLNANVHCNGDIILGEDNVVKGFVTYIDTSTVPGGSAWNKVSPPQNSKGLPSHYISDPIDIPVFDPITFLSAATTVYPGNVNWSGNINLGTITDPVLIYCKGNLNVSNSTKINGYGIIVVVGTTYIGDNCKMDQTTSNVYLYGNSDINIHDNNTLAMHIYTNHNFTAHDHLTLYGNVVAHDKLILSHDQNMVYYIPSDNSLYRQFSWNYGFGKQRMGIQYWYE